MKNTCTARIPQLNQYIKFLYIEYFEASVLNIYIIFHWLKSGQLNEYTERKDMSADVICMALASVPSGEQRSRFLAVGLADNTVRIISLDPSVIIIHLLFVSYWRIFSSHLKSFYLLTKKSGTSFIWHVSFYFYRIV